MSKSDLRLRAEVALERDRFERQQPQNATTYKTTSGTAGSQLYEWMTGHTGHGLSGHVSESKALTHDAVYACVGLIGGAIAALPFHLYKRTPDGRERYQNDLWWLFNESPWENWTAASAWQHAAQSILLKGDAFWEIHRTRYGGEISGFEPHHPDDVVVIRDSGRNLYSVTGEDGARRTIDAADMLHFSGIGFDGVRSITPIHAALGKVASGAIGADEHAATFFAGGAQPNYALQAPAEVIVDKEQRDAIRNGWLNYRQGLGQGLPPLLTGGIEVKPLTMNASDSQLLESRQYSVEQIARIFGVPPHMIGKTDAATSWGSGIEQMSIGFVRYTLRRHLDVIQQEINRKVWPRSRAIYGEFNADALLDGDSKAQAEYFAKALGGPGSQGWMAVNEVRKLKNLPPIDGGDVMIMAVAAAPMETEQNA